MFIPLKEEKFALLIFKYNGDYLFVYYLHSIESPSVPIQAMYASNLTTESAHYFRDCIRPNYYFEAIEIDVVEDGSYTIGISSEKYICDYLHENKFNPFDPLGKQIIKSDPFGQQIIGSDCDRFEMKQIKFIHHLQKHITYILVVTTRSPNETGSFSVIVLGPNNVTLKRNGECMSFLSEIFSKIFILTYQVSYF